MTKTKSKRSPTPKKGRARGVRRRRIAKTIDYDGQTLKSNLELTMYKLLKEHKIPFEYEGQKFVIIEGFHSHTTSYERFLNGKGDFKDRGDKNIPDMIYTPDFTPPRTKPLSWVIETKGRAMPDFSRTWKLFKKILFEEEMDTVLFMPRRKADCVEVIKLIKKMKLDE